MTGEAGKGAWMWRTTIGGDSDGGWEKYWDPDATPMSDEEAQVRYRRLLQLLFGPRPGDA
ncbi:hypothetical protein [Streptomyces sp. NPDC101166]|uniref:hypothetical protein n=1 Tax=Streptomyces sp. NPDC101166 TaxID=3366120 RepID=UPI0038005747